MANVLTLFPLSVYQDRMLLDADLQQRLVQAVCEMGEQPILKQATGSTWTGDVNGYGMLHRDPVFAPLFAGFTRHLKGYLDLLSIDPDKLHLYYTRAWATIARGPEKIQPHRHQQSHISLVYYLKKPPNSGDITFIDHLAPNQFAPQIFREPMLQHGILREFQQFNAIEVDIGVNEGDVLIFPSDCMHSTRPNNSDQPRISIAVDIITTVKESRGLEYLIPDPEKWEMAVC